MESKDNMDKISDHSYRISGGYAAEIDKAARLANIKGAIDNYHPQTSVRPDLNDHVQMFRDFCSSLNFRRKKYCRKLCLMRELNSL